jgi:DNA-binding Xre family transcriptional regulator
VLTRDGPVGLDNDGLTTRITIDTVRRSLKQENGMHRVANAALIKRAVASQMETAMRAKGLSKAETTRRMHTSRAALNRLVDPMNDAVTLSTLTKAAAVLRCELRLELV